MCIRDGDRERDSALIRGARMTPAWQPNFFSGRIVVMVGVSLCKSSAAFNGIGPRAFAVTEAACGLTTGH
jgi:hypothetical protein